ncbi:MAG TPA: 2-amino-4-hydroxy-6-hydroxymethyldihydropteridine diphosphokinase [Savagea sp.]
MNRVYLSIGSNIGNRMDYLTRAIEQLQHHPAIQVKRQSSVYETEPVGLVDQANFLNIVVEIETNLEADALLQVCQLVEELLGRERVIRWGPRTVDVDILLFNEEVIRTESLIIPHERMHERLFVLVPLLELSPGLVHSETQRPLKQYVKEATGEVWIYGGEESS